MATLALQTVSEAGLTFTHAAATAGGDAFVNGAEDVFLSVKNAGGTACNVTLNVVDNTLTVTGHGDVTKANAVVTVPITTGHKLIGPFPRLDYCDAAGRVNVTYDQVTSVTVAAVRLPRLR